ncbi:hypothetical protein [Roseivirga sp.]|uniref:hypothetical protein n=1 Tax=Roseivirga sp. TaxID=1964215 RepID=UPI002B26828C|nr:hypothetical protein [Roseivirga sp.]
MNSKFKLHLNHLLIVVLMLIFIVSCSKDDETTPGKIETSLTGKAQKGPFLNGSSISIYELDKKFSPTGINFNTQITDNSGLFQINDIKLASNYVTLRVDGFYFNEVCGELSGSQITLNGIADISQSDFKNLNVITHLEKARVEFLLSEGMSFTSAKSQAQQEVLNIFNVSDDIENSEELDISGNSDGDAILIAISSILQGYRSESEFSLLLANIITDIKTDGSLDNESIGADLVSHAQLLNAERISNNIESRYSDLGIDITVPDFEPIVNNFLQETTFPSNESLINYPEDGSSGSNVLNLALTEIQSKTFYSLAATLPNECLSLRVKITKISGLCDFCIGHQPTKVQNWWIQKYDSDTHSQSFSTSGKLSDLPIIIEKGVFLVEYFEGDTSIPTRTKTINSI